MPRANPGRRESRASMVRSRKSLLPGVVPKSASATPTSTATRGQDSSVMAGFSASDPSASLARTMATAARTLTSNPNAK
jgi:hypothetical protein